MTRKCRFLVRLGGLGMTTFFGALRKRHGRDEKTPRATSASAQAVAPAEPCFVRQHSEQKANPNNRDTQILFSL